MDKLSDLPTAETEPTPQENQVMEKYFPEDEDSESNPKPVQKKKLSWTETFKLAGMAALLFLALSNSWVDVIFDKIPYCGENPLTLSGVKTLVFLILFVVMYRYLL